MSKKTQHEHPSDDWAGLAQNLFGINLEKATGDEDLLDDDMFKVELPKPPEPIPAAESQDERTVTADIVPPDSSASQPTLATKPATTAPPRKVPKIGPLDAAEPFGFGVLDETELSVATSVPGVIGEPLSEPAIADDGLTLALDDVEGLTLPPDYDDGLTLAPESVASAEQLPEREEEEEEEEEGDGDTEVLPIEDRDGGLGRTGPRRRRYPRRTREDAYWDMLENWEWEEIPDSDAPSAEGEGPRFRRGDRGRGLRGERGRRDRGREERPRSDERFPSAERPQTDTRVHESEARSSEAASPKSEYGERTPRPRRGDRPRDDRSPREERPRRERTPRPESQRRDESRPPAAAQRSQSAKPPAASLEDFGAGIFEDGREPLQQSFEAMSERSDALSPCDEVVAQSSQAADAVLRDARHSTGRSGEDDLVWPEDDSDVRPAPEESVVETSRLPAAETAGESDETMSASDVEPLESQDDDFRPRRRRRRRRGGRPETNLPPDGNEGTTFDLSEALSGENETPDFIPSAVAEDAEVSETPVGDASAEEVEAQDEDRFSEQRGGRRRRRRRRRPGDGIERESAGMDQADASQEGAGATEVSEEEEYIVKPIVYANIPSWEEAIRYLLQPHLVGRNLGPEDEGESLENDPRGSGGAEPMPAPPPPRRRGGRGGGGRGGRRP